MKKVLLAIMVLLSFVCNGQIVDSCGLLDNRVVDGISIEGSNFSYRNTITSYSSIISSDSSNYFFLKTERNDTLKVIMLVIDTGVVIDLQKGYAGVGNGPMKATLDKVFATFSVYGYSVSDYNSFYVTYLDAGKNPLPKDYIVLEAISVDKNKIPAL